MTQPNVLVSVNAGTPTGGGVTVPSAATIAISFANTNGWRSYRLELLLPPGPGGAGFVAAPTGWTDEGNGIASYAGVTTPPATFTLGTSDVAWGKYMLTLTTSNGITDTLTALSMLSPIGLEDTSSRESGQFDATRAWGGGLQRNNRRMGDALGGGIPAIINVSGAVPAEQTGDSPSDNKRVERRLRFMDLDPDIDFRGLNDPTYTVAKTFPGTPPWVGGADTTGTTPLLVRRGSVLTLLAVSANIVGDHVNFTSSSFDTTYANGAAAYASDGVLVVDSSIPDMATATFGDPSSGDQTNYAVLLVGTDSGADPSATFSFTGDVDINFGLDAALTRTWTTEAASKTVVACSDIYWGHDVTDDVIANDVWEGNSSPHGFGSALKRDRVSGVQTITLGDADAYVFFLWPHQAAYTSGGTPVLNDATGQSYPWAKRPSTVTILRNGVSRTYDVWRTNAKLAAGRTLLLQSL